MSEYSRPLFDDPEVLSIADDSYSSLMDEKLAAVPVPEGIAYDNPDYRGMASGDARKTSPLKSIYPNRVYIGKVSQAEYDRRIRDSPVEVILDQIGKHPELEDTEVKNLVSQYQTYGDLKAKDTVVLHNLGLAVYDTKRAYRMAKAQGATVEFADILQEAIIGLVRAVETHDLDKATEAGVRFSTWAMIHIKGHTSRFVDNQNIIRIPVHTQKEIRDLAIRERQIIETQGRTPTTADLFDTLEPSAELLAAATEEEREPDPFAWQYSEQQIGLARQRIEALANATGASADNVRWLQAASKLRRVLSFDLLPEDHEALVDDTSSAPLVHAIQNDRKERVRSTLSSIDDMRREVLERRYGLHGGSPETLEEVSRTLNVRKERVRQIENQSLKKLGSEHEYSSIGNLLSATDDDPDTAPKGVRATIKSPYDGRKLTSNDEPGRQSFLKQQQSIQLTRAARHHRYAQQDSAKQAQAQADQKRMAEGQTRSKKLPVMRLMEQRHNADLINRVNKQRLADENTAIGFWSRR